MRFSATFATGVPVFWAETSLPEFHAAIVFRVGRADEPVPLGASAG